MASVKKLTPDSIADLVVIEQMCFGEDKWNADMLASEFANPLSEILGIEKNGRIVAYLSAQMIFDEAHIGNVAVLPDFRRKGYASKLLKHLFKMCLKAGVRRFTLEVSVNNLPAITLYKTHGFTAGGMRRAYYRNGDDALIMWKSESYG